MANITNADLKKRQDKLDSYLKVLDEDGRAREKALLGEVRSAVRKAWMFHPTKMSLLYKNTVPDTDTKSRTKWLFPCNICGGLFKGADVQVDHIKGEHSLLCYEDIPHFAKSVLGVSWADLQILCKEDHEIKTYAERWGLTFEQARGEKEVIAVAKLTAPRQRKWLTARKIKPASNKDGRVVQIREYLNRKREG